MTKKYKIIKCEICNVRIPKKKVCYYHTNKVCNRCFRRLRYLKSSIPEVKSNNKLSFIDALIKKYGFERR